MVRNWPRPSVRMSSIACILVLTAVLGAGCEREPAAMPAPVKTAEKAATAPEAPKTSAAEAVKSSAAVGIQRAEKAASKSGIESTLETPALAIPEPEKPVVIPADLKPLAIPADGDRQGTKVEGAAVARIRILRGGAEVLVDTDGFQPVTWDQQFLRQGPLPPGYFDLRKADTNRDGDYRDELSSRPGLWKMDEKGNITRF